MAAIRQGLKATFLSTSSLYHDLKASGGSDVADQITALNKRHRSRVIGFLKEHAYRCWKAVALFPVLPTVEKVLTSDELIIEYVFIGKHDESSLKASLELNILAFKPDGTKEVCAVSERKCVEAIKAWIRQWNIVTVESLAGIQSDEEKKFEAVGQELSSILFPNVIQNLIRCKDVKHIYLCPEPHFSMIPLKLLPGEDTLPLFEGRTISFLGACREIVRLEVMAQLDKDECHPRPCLNEPLDSSTSVDDKVNSKKSEAAGCYIFFDPNFDHKLESQSVDGKNLWEQICALNPFRPAESLCHSLDCTRIEAYSIVDILKVRHPNGDVHLFQGAEANLQSVISLRSPLLVHFSTHGFGRLQFQFELPNVSQDESGSGLALAGFNTYITKKFAFIDPKASTGMLTPLTVCGLDLANTRLVFLSTCVSGVGVTQLQESTNSLASAFRAAGALTVIATSWNIDDGATAVFVSHFYNALCQTGTRPSEALDRARVELCKDPRFSSWRYWAGFSCHGDDIPVFSEE